MRPWIFGILMIMMSCHGQKKASTDSTTIKVENGLVLLVQDNYSGLNHAETRVIRDKKALQKFYALVNRTRKPGLPVPQVDFTKDMVLVHCSGEQPASIKATLSILKETENQLVLKTNVQKVEKRASATVITSPFSVYKLPMTGKEVIFEKEK